MKIPSILIPLALSVPSAFAAVSLPYSNNFSSSAADFTPNNAGQWSLESGTYQNVVPGDMPSYSMLEVTGRAAPQPFQVSTTFRITAAVGNWSVGFAALASSTNLGGASYYLADINQAGDMRFRVFNSGAPVAADSVVTATGTSVGGITFSDTITLTLTGTYDMSGALSLALTSFDGTNTQTVTLATPIASASAFTGNFFGYRERSNSVGAGMTVQLDNFSITPVPEPGSVALLGLGLVGAIARRRR